MQAPLSHLVGGLASNTLGVCFPAGWLFFYCFLYKRSPISKYPRIPFAYTFCSSVFFPLGQWKVWFHQGRGYSADTLPYTLRVCSRTPCAHPGVAPDSDSKETPGSWEKYRSLTLHILAQAWLLLVTFSIARRPSLRATPADTLRKHPRNPKMHFVRPAPQKHICREHILDTRLNTRLGYSFKTNFGSVSPWNRFWILVWISI